MYFHSEMLGEQSIRSAWDVIAVSSSSAETCDAYVSLLEAKQRRLHSQIDERTAIISIPDPECLGGIGSGGAMLNAVLVITEILSARSGETSILPSSLNNKHVLVLSVSTRGRRAPGFLGIPAVDEEGEIITTIDLLLETLTVNGAPASCPPGIWNASTEALLLVPQGGIDFSALRKGECIAAALSFPCSVPYGMNHGVYDVDEDTGLIRRLIYRGSQEEVEKAIIKKLKGAARRPKVPLVCGLAYFDTAACKELLSLVSGPPFDASTYLGVDDGAKPVSLSLYLDILAALATHTDREAFVASRGDFADVLWRSLRGKIELKTVAVNTLYAEVTGLRKHDSAPPTPLQLGGGGEKTSHSQYLFIRDSSDYANAMKTPSRALRDKIDEYGGTAYNCVRSHVQGGDSVFQSDSEGDAMDCVVVNSYIKGETGVLLGPGALVEHSKLTAPINVSASSFVSGIRSLSLSRVPANTVVQEVAVLGGETYLVCHGVDDCILGETAGRVFFGTPFDDSNPTICALLWDEGNSARTMSSARIFPSAKDIGDVDAYISWISSQRRFQNEFIVEHVDCFFQWRNARRISLDDLALRIDVSAEVAWQRRLSFCVDEARVVRILRSRSHSSTRPLYERMARERHMDMIGTLDELLQDEALGDDVAARIMASIADLLYSFVPSGFGGLRSGPARNERFLPAFEALEKGDRSRAVRMMILARKEWVEAGIDSRSSSATAKALIRAARHYEGAASILIRRAVSTATAFIENVKSPLPDAGLWTTVESGIRIDIAGGWTDTPPISYEAGGAVTNVAVLLDGKRPLGCKARRARRADGDSLIKFTLVGLGDTHCFNVSDMMDYCRPSAPAALLKAAILCIGIVSLDSGAGTLEEQLQRKLGPGMKLEIESWSHVPQGSGLGTSSILAGCILKAIGVACGADFKDNASLVHAVLKVEQMLTTGGGWQDQVGLCGGFNIARSDAALPLRVTVDSLKVSASAIAKFETHTILVFTGRARLARNLLQNVLRRWYARLPNVVATVNSLRKNAESAASAFEAGNLEQVGACLRKYWAQKKTMAAGCEPEFIGRTLHILREAGMLHGESLCGAGGGGFMCLITSMPNAMNQVKTTLTNAGVNIADMTFHAVSVDVEGMHVS